MKLALALAPALLLATAPASGARQAAGGTQEGAPSPVKTSELAEAARLTSEVVRLHGEGKFAEALPLAERALAIREKSLGGEHPLVANALLNVATLLTAREKYQQAEDYYRRAAAVYEKAGADLQVADARRQLGAVLARRGDHSSAQTALESAVAHAEKAGDGGRAVSADSLNLLAQVYLSRGDVERAAPAWQRARSTWRALYGKDDPRVEAAEDAMLCFSVRALKPDKWAEFNGRVAALEEEATGVDPKAALRAAGVLQGKVIRKPPPKYPDDARARGVMGTVIVRVVVDEAGKVISAKSICGPPQLAAASEEAARQAVFTPTLLSGQPVKVTGVITYNYVLR